MTSFEKSALHSDKRLFALVALVLSSCVFPKVDIDQSLAAAGAGDNGGSGAGTSQGGGGSGGTGNVGAQGGAAGHGGAGGQGGIAGQAGTAGHGGSGGQAGAGGQAGTNSVPLPSDRTGLVSVPSLAIRGYWYAYGDGIGPDGKVPDSPCVLVGMHMAADCSKIDKPPYASFPNTSSRMCTSGRVAKVITGSVGCMAPATTCPDYGNLFGAGIGFDLNDPLSGAAQPYNATDENVIGISFDIDDLPTAGMRVEFTTSTTEKVAAIWKPDAGNLSPLVSGHNVLLFADAKSPSYVSPVAPLDPTTLTTIQFHVVTTIDSATDYAFCISNLAAVIKNK